MVKLSNSLDSNTLDAIATSTYATQAYTLDYDHINNVVCGASDMQARIDNLDGMVKKPEVAIETTTKLDIKNNKIYVKHYKDGFFERERTIMPSIKDIKVHDKSVVMTFADNTKTVAVLHDEDKFNLEQGISICITKKLLGNDGGAIYNKLIKKAFKIMDQNEKVDKAAKEKEEAAKQRKKAIAAKRDKKKVKKRNEQIEIQKEAFIRAFEAITANCDNLSKYFKTPLDK